MEIVVSKTDYLLYRECPKNAWYKIHKPGIYDQSELTEFEQSLLETGNEVELIARKLFPDGILIERRDIEGQQDTQKLLKENHKLLYQPIFVIN
ncbi:MAG: hypothetical protein HY606_05300, partial [Planctomycetes bacterium]|nr:hypothetical protein [Planctomycetota bacterium]